MNYGKVPAYNALAQAPLTFLPVPTHPSDRYFLDEGMLPRRKHG